MNTQVIILQYNTKELTESLYGTLKPYEKSYEVIVLDNGSDPDRVSSCTTYRLEENLYYGGGLNVALNLFLSSPEFDSVMILNNDIICHGEGFINTLQEEMLIGEFDIISPCVLEPHTGDQTCWKQMRPWHTGKTRQVPWVDYQAPLLSRRFVETIFPFPYKLQYGWGQDILSGVECSERGWKIGVCDKVPIIHLVSQTINLNPEKLSDVNRLAESNMFQYFHSIGKLDLFHDLRTKAFKYKYE